MGMVRIKQVMQMSLNVESILCNLIEQHLPFLNIRNDFGTFDLLAIEIYSIRLITISIVNFNSFDIIRRNK